MSFFSSHLIYNLLIISMIYSFYNAIFLLL